MPFTQVIISGNKSYACLLSLIILFSSCYREEVISPPVCNDCTKPVVLCFIGPGDSIFAFATSSYAFGEKIDKINSFQGDIFIYDTTGLSLELKPCAGKPNFFGAAQNKFPIKPGNKYRLEVLSSNGTKSMAYTTVPSTADTISQAEVIGTQEDEDGLWYLTKVTWKNSTKTNNLIGEREYDKNIKNTSGTVLYGDEINVLGNYIFEYTSFSSVIYWQHTIFTLYTIDNHFDQYLRSYILFYGLSVSLDSNSVVEMFNGIIPQYSNFDNCYGVFGSYITDTVTVFNPGE